MNNDETEISESDLPAGFSPVVEEEIEIDEVVVVDPLLEPDAVEGEEDDLDDLQIYLNESLGYDE